MAQRLGQRVAELQIEHAASTVARAVTVSLGVCTRRPDATGSAADLLREADAQLYRAKSRGRNQVCGPDMPAT